MHDCDGSTNNGTHNCPKRAVWQVKQKDSPQWVWSACAQHLNQVATWLLGGEQGELDLRRIATTAE
ncbi:hypothetical protein [Streptomyces sp. TRM68367]|uniref:hypothetical protein n=1 Tax=Streptomyces sp. TRM68367 TaxID=2758415 RepID=UPI00165A8174|nr:hypothetical protein [Streptomyces sp. TRM68367]MBC9730699.1 hypothetical protein [Streptomyces sp. TRM68367]